MAILNIRRRAQSKLSMPEPVRVDYSAIGNNAMTRLQAQGGGVGLAKGLEQFARAATQGIEELNRTDEREATKAAQSVRVALDKEKELMLRAMEEDPSNATGWEDKWEAAREKAYKDAKVAEMGEYRREEFMRQMEVHNHNGWVSLYRTSNTVKDRADKQSANAELDSAVKDVWETPAVTTITDPETGESYGTLVDNETAVSNAYKALDRAAKANRWTAEEFQLNKANLDANLAKGIAERAIAGASTLEDVKALRSAFDSIGSDKTDTANLSKLFGAVNYNALTPEVQIALRRDLDRRETEMLKVQAAETARITAEQDAYIAETNTLYRQNQLTYTHLKARVTEAQTKKWPAKKVLELQKLADQAKAAEVDEWAAIVEDNPYLFDRLMNGKVKAVREVPDEIKSDPVFMKRLRNARDVGIEAEAKTRDLTTAATLDQLIYGEETQHGIPAQQREESIRKLQAERRISAEQAEKAIREMNKFNAGRYKKYANSYASMVGGATTMMSLTPDADGVLVVDYEKTYDGLMRRFKGKFTNEEDVNNASYITESMRRSWQKFTQWCDMNPTAKEEEVMRTFSEAFAPFATVFTMNELDDLTPRMRGQIERAQNLFNEALRKGKNNPVYTYIPAFPVAERGSRREMNTTDNAPSETDAE